jgi:hypothetical protein
VTSDLGWCWKVITEEDIVRVTSDLGWCWKVITEEDIKRRHKKKT